MLTIVWARRFAEYKRADLIKRDIVRFNRLMKRNEKRIQIIWAGKPYPGDENAKSLFNHLVHSSRHIPNATVLTGYELHLSGVLKKGADVWLNNPRRPREASGTSGMTAAMNGVINFSISDGWIPEFAKHKENCFLLPVTDERLPVDQVDNQDAENMLDMLEREIIPMYYDDKAAWLKMMKQSINDVIPAFESNRMADEYYKLFNQ